MQGGADPLWSEFRLGYAPLLAQIRSEDADPETLLGASFRQFQLQRALPALRSAIAAKVPPSHTAAGRRPSWPRSLQRLLPVCLFIAVNRSGKNAMTRLGSDGVWQSIVRPA